MNLVLFPHLRESVANLFQDTKPFSLSVTEKVKFRGQVFVNFIDIDAYAIFLDSRHCSCQLLASLSLASHARKGQTKTLNGVGQISVNQFRCVCESDSTCDPDHIFAISHKLVQYEHDATRLADDHAFQCADVNGTDRIASFFEIAKRWVKQPLNPQPIRPHLQRHKLLVPQLTTVVGNAHLANGVPSRNNCGSSAYERLKIVYKIAPSVACLTSYSPRKPENERQDNRRAANQCNQSQNPSFVEFRHRCPLKMLPVCKRSHFSHELQSGAWGIAA